MSTTVSNYKKDGLFRICEQDRVKTCYQLFIEFKVEEWRMIALL